jgi:hypothetical protein
MTWYVYREVEHVPDEYEASDCGHDHEHRAFARICARRWARDQLRHRLPHSLRFDVRNR